ncbi:MAG: glycosyltransferase family 39 protein, partial [Stellaceae bacterium]
MAALGRGRDWPRLIVPAAVVALALCYFIDPNPRLDFSAFDTRDAESYLALSRALASGVGYTRNLDPQFYIPHTTWPPGLPVLLLPWVALAGMPMDLLAVKIGMILYGVLGIGLAYCYARRIGGSRFVRLCAPLMLGLDPYYWQFSRMALSEVPTVLWALVALLLAEIGWAKGAIRPGRAFAFGLIAGLGMLIRGSFFGALFLPLVYLLFLRPVPIDRRRIGAYLAYAAGFVLPFALWTIRCHAISNPALGQD